MKRTIPLVLLATAVVATLAACTPRDVMAWKCLDNGAPVLDVPSDHNTPWPSSLLPIPQGTTIDARGELFDNSTLNSSGFGLGIKVHDKPGRTDLCLVGGTISASSAVLDPELTSWDTYHRVTGMTIEVDNFTVTGTKLHNQGDGIAFVGAANWKVIGVEAEAQPGEPGAYIHDDCIENDGMATGLIEDVKLDGCNTFLSSMSSANGTGNTVEVRDSLVRLQPFYNSYNTTKYGFNQHGGFFKWASPSSGGVAPALVLKDSIFRADQRGKYSGNVNGLLGLPPGAQCENVTLVGWEVWRPADVDSWRNQCTNLKLGSMADWNAAVAEWDAAHPDL